MIHYFFCIPFSNTTHLRERLFLHIILWIGSGMLCAGCATRYPDISAAENSGPVSQIICFYQGPLDHLSAVRLGACPMEPHCSAYALEAIKKHGPFMGLMMTFDRLIRCGGDERHLSPKVWANGHRLIYDPLAANEWASGSFYLIKKDWEISVE